MTTIFIAGSISISRLHEKVQERIRKIASADFKVVVGDADGADTSIQHCLSEVRASRVTVFCSGERPRNNVADWPVHRVHSEAKEGSRAFFTAKDVEMAQNSDFGLMIWDCKSTGTLSNVIELLRNRRTSVVFVNKNQDFVNVADRSGLESLLAFMSKHARLKAEEKIGLSAKMLELDQEPLSFAKSASAEPVSFDLADGATKLTESAVSGTAQTASIKLTFELMSTLMRYLDRSELSQLEAARMFGVSQPCIAELTRGRIESFKLDALVNMASSAGLKIEMRVEDTISELQAPLDFS